jgi:hypothetical protein
MDASGDNGGIAGDLPLSGYHRLQPAGFNPEASSVLA